MKKKLLVTGANGFVAGSIFRQGESLWELHGVSHGPSVQRHEHFRAHVCGDRNSLTALFREIEPDAVIHTAALADIDFCQANPELARQANVDLTRTYVELCQESGARLIFCSTDTVFDGEQAPYLEEQTPTAVNFYAETKIAAEKLVSQLGPGSVVARLSLVVGLPLIGAGNSFLPKMLDSFRRGCVVTVPEREVRTPVDVVTAGKALLEFAEGPHHGIFHVAGNERMNRFAMAQTIAARFGFSKDLVLAQAEPPPGPGDAPAGCFSRQLENSRHAQNTDA